MRSPDENGKIDLGRGWYIRVVDGVKTIDETIIKKFMTPKYVVFDYPTQKIKVLSAAAGSLHFVSA